MKGQDRSDAPEDRPNRQGRVLWICAIVLIYALPLVTIRGAVDMFIKIDGIDGESKDAKHKDEIDVLAWSWGVSQSGSFHVGGGGAGKANFQDLSVTKFIDKATAGLALACTNGKHIDEATLTVRANDGKKPLEYLIITMKKVQVTSFGTGGGDGDPVRETFSLSYNDISERVFTFDDDGNVIGEFETFWNVPTDTGGGNELVTNTAPTITAIPDQTTGEDGTPIVVTFTISDAETPAGALILGRSSGNLGLIPNENIVFGGAGVNRTATITPAPDQNGTSSLILTVSDGSMSASTNFLVTVTPDNDPPSVLAVPTQVTDQDTPLDVAVTLADIDDDPASLILTATSSNPGVLTNAGISIPPTGNPRILTLTPVPGASGETVVTLTAEDDGALASPPVDFSLLVNGQGTGIDDLTLDGLPPGEHYFALESTPTGTQLGPIEVVPPNPGALYDYLLLDDAGGRFALDPADRNVLIVADSSLLDFETNPFHTIVVQVTDVASGATRTKAFAIELTNANEPPLVTVPATFGTAAPNQLWSLDGISINDPDSGPNPILATFTVTSGELYVTNALLPGATITGDGTSSITITATVGDLNTMLSTFAGLTYRSDPTFTGTETVTITTDDQGFSGDGTGSLTGAASSTLEVELTPWQEWRLLNFTGTQLDDLSISGFGADPDFDGLANGGEYGVGGDPWDPGDGPDKVRVISDESGGLTFPAVIFPRRTSDPDLNIDVEVATDVLNWSWGPAFTFEESAPAIDTDFDQPTIRSLRNVTQDPRQQLRLRFVLDD